MKRLLKKVGVTWQISFLTCQIYFLIGQIYFLTFQRSFLTFQKYHRRSYLIEGLYDDLFDRLRLYWWKRQYGSFTSWKQQISKVKLCFLRIEMSPLHCSTHFSFSPISNFITSAFCWLKSGVSFCQRSSSIFTKSASPKAAAALFKTQFLSRRWWRLFVARGGWRMKALSKHVRPTV